MIWQKLKSPCIEFSAEMLERKDILGQQLIRDRSETLEILLGFRPAEQVDRQILPIS